jgi:hypothetical protein
VERGRCEHHVRTVADAITAYHDAHQDVGAETKYTRRRTLGFLKDFLHTCKVQTVDQIDLDMLNRFRSTRTLSPRTWVKELEILRHFLRFCLDNEWVARNWAQKVHMPKNLKPAPREPYEPNEIAKIIAACRTSPGTGHGAAAALHGVTHLRCGQLRHDRIRDGEVFLRTAKNGKPVKLPVHPDLQAALDILPLPRGAGQDATYFFWSAMVPCGL